MESHRLAFPANFYWGASTSAHQVEGGLINDWTEWEKVNAKRLAASAKREFGHLPSWPKIQSAAVDPQNYLSGSASDHYHLYQKDFDLAQSLGLNAYRFSVDWSRIEPQPGKFSSTGLNYYKKVAIALRKRKIEPFLTLWHWPIPLWLRDRGGWGSKEVINHFAGYTEAVVKALKDDVTFWITLNEPQIYAANAYLRGLWPPQRRNPFTYLTVLNHLIAAHREAYRVIKTIHPSAQVGVAKNNIWFEAYRNRLPNLAVKALMDWWWNDRFLRKIDNYQDFIGLNHYFHSRINYGLNKNQNQRISDLGWELYPESIYFVLKDLRKYQKPVYITENGLADHQDVNRTWFIKEVLKNVHRAIAAGVDIRGYLHWSLIDNFEWDRGFWPRFGLIEVDYPTQKRTIRKSAFEYAKIAKSNCLEA